MYWPAPRAGLALAALDAEQRQLAFMLVAPPRGGSPPAARRARAVIDDRAPDDIVTTNAPAVDHDLSGGLALSDLSGEAAEVARQLVALHVERLPPALAEAVQRRVDGEVAGIHFA